MSARPYHMPGRLSGRREMVRHAAGLAAESALAAAEKDVLLLVLDDAREAVVRVSLRRYAMDQTKAAQALGVNRTTLRKFMRRYGLLVRR